MPPTTKRSSLMSDLGNECGHSFGADNLEAPHGRVEDRNKNAGFGAGVREDLQSVFSVVTKRLIHFLH